MGFYTEPLSDELIKILNNGLTVSYSQPISLDFSSTDKPEWQLFKEVAISRGITPPSDEELQKMFARNAKNIEAIEAALLNLLANDESIEVKNRSALALSDMRSQKAVPLLFQIIQDPKYKNCNGTLVYCLEGLDCVAYRDVLEELAEDESCEVKASARVILAAMS